MAVVESQDGDAVDRNPARRQKIDKYLGNGTEGEGDDGKNLTKEQRERAAEVEKERKKKESDDLMN